MTKTKSTPPNSKRNPKEAPAFTIGKPGGQCVLSNQPIEPGDHFIATMCEVPVEPDGKGCADSSTGETGTILGRRDVSEEAWERGERPDGIVFYWRSCMPQPNDKVEPFVDNEVLYNLFERLADDAESQRQAYRFVLGLILMRKKVLRCVSTECHDGQSVWMMKRRGDAPETPPVKMVDPQLADSEVRTVADQLGEVFREDFE